MTEAQRPASRPERAHFLAELDQAVQSWHKRSGTMFDGEVVADELNLWFKRFREATEWSYLERELADAISLRDSWERHAADCQASLVRQDAELERIRSERGLCATAEECKGHRDVTRWVNRIVELEIGLKVALGESTARTMPEVRALLAERPDLTKEKS